MKQNLFKSLLIALLAAMLPQLASAYDFKVDGLCYNYNDDGTSVTVTYEKISPNGYYGYSNLSGSLNIPSTVTYSGTTYSVTTIGSRAFHYCPDLTSVTIPNSVTSIGDLAFYNCTGLTSVTIGNSVKTIGDGAFYDCKGLKSVTWNATNCDDFSKDHRPFRGFEGSLTNIQSFTFGNEVNHIPDYLCYGLIGLTSVTIPNSVTSVGYGAFNGCKGLTSVTIGNSVTTICKGAFWDCSGLTSVTWNATNCDDFSYESTPFYKPNYYSKIKTFSFGSTVRKIPAYLCYDLDDLTSVTIPNSVTSIGDYAFKSCSGLTSVTIPNSVTEIGDRAFDGCRGLTNITIPNSVTSIGDYAFCGCSGLTSVSIPNSVREIGDGTFASCSSLTSVTIPNSVTSIGEYAFSNCSGLTSVTIPNSVTSIGEYAFRGCSGLTSVSIGNSVTSIGDYAFSDCSGLTSVTIPNSVTSIGDYAFYLCTGLTSVAIGNSVTSIGEYAFRECRGLTSVTIPYSVAKIGNYAFYLCTGLTSVIWNAKTCEDIVGPNTSPFWLTNIQSFTFGNEVNHIPGRLCDGLEDLTSLTIPYSVTSIGYKAFYDCSSLKNIYAALNPDNVQLGSSVFGGVPKYTCYLHVQEEYVNAFKTADQWREFKNIFGDFIDESAIEEVRVDELDSSQPIDVYNMNGVKVAQSLDNLPPGIYIVRQGSKSAKIRK